MADNICNSEYSFNSMMFTSDYNPTTKNRSKHEHEKKRDKKLKRKQNLNTLSNKLESKIDLIGSTLSQLSCKLDNFMAVEKRNEIKGFKVESDIINLKSNINSIKILSEDIKSNQKIIQNEIYMLKSELLAFKKESEATNKTLVKIINLKQEQQRNLDQFNEDNQGRSKQNDELEQAKTAETLSNRSFVKYIIPVKPIKEENNYRAPKKSKGLPSEADNLGVKSDNEIKYFRGISNKIAISDVSSLNNQIKCYYEKN